jgi:hypothetical protein
MDNPISMLLLLTGGGVFIGMLAATLEAIRLLQAKKSEQDGANVILSVLFGGFIFLCTPVVKMFYAVIVSIGAAQKAEVSPNVMMVTGVLFAVVAIVQGLLASRFAKASETDTLAVISAKLPLRLLGLFLIEVVAIVAMVFTLIFA